MLVELLAAHLDSKFHAKVCAINQHAGSIEISLNPMQSGSNYHDLVNIR